jgi:HK97 family phage prohead protease
LCFVDRVKKIKGNVMNKNIENRDCNHSELRSTKRTEDAGAKISGYAAVFERDSEYMGFVEQIAPGAFREALKKSDVRCLVNHDPNEIIGRTGVNLTLKEDETGLYMELTEPPGGSARYDQVARDVESGLITQQSFGFTIKKDSWKGLDEDIPLRTIEEVDSLLDTSLVVYPAYPDTTVAIRSLSGAKGEEENSIVIEYDGVEYKFKDNDTFDAVVEKINETRKTSPLTAVIWAREASPLTPVSDIDYNLLTRIKNFTEVKTDE